MALNNQDGKYRGGKIGIIILNFNTCEETILCVESIEKYTKLPYVIYVVDNASTDGSFRFLETHFQNDKNVILIDAGENRGYSAGNNIGLKLAKRNGCDIAFVVNSDVELLNDAFAIMTDTLLDSDEYMMIGPSVRDNDGRESQLARKKKTFKNFVLARHPFASMRFFQKLSDRTVNINTRAVSVFEGSVSGCCFGMRMSDFSRVGYFDENVFLYCEEDILAYKMSEIGKKAVVNTDAKVWHKANVSTNKEGKAFVRFHAWNSTLYLLKRYIKANKAALISVALTNTMYWFVLSLASRRYRDLFFSFWRANWKIALEK